MPANTYRFLVANAGDILVPANSRRVMLVYTSRDSNQDVILIGNSQLVGIPLLADLGGPQTLLFNIVGTALYGQVSMLIRVSASPFTITEIYRTVSGIT